MLSGEGDAGCRDGAQRAGGAGVVPEPESQGENKSLRNSRPSALNSLVPSRGPAANKSAQRCVLNLSLHSFKKCFLREKKKSDPKELQI